MVYKYVGIALVFFFFINNAFSQDREIDKCGHIDSARIQEELKLRGDHWGYGYDDLLLDLVEWEMSPYISIDSIGLSVQGRPLWELTITSNDTTITDKHTVYIHVRTHPNEVQSFWVADEMIKFLISEDSIASKIRERTIFYFVPMYNPDGVELEYARENANSIDIESNWYSTDLQPEVKALRSRFEELMNSDNPIEVALNLHSAYKCKRYFVFHHLNGTSYAYTQMEKRFIDFVRSYFIGGIEPWSFIVTWSGGTPNQYPESWWWLNHGSNVMALTYEDGNCAEAGSFDKTAYALVMGVTDFLGITNSTNAIEEEAISNYVLEQSFPNPANHFSSTPIQINYKIPNLQNVKIELFSLNGKRIKVLDEGIKQSGWHTVSINSNNLEVGMYYYRLVGMDGILSKKLVIIQ